MQINDCFLLFLKKYCPERQPMLLGLSGGSDSMALFHLLLRENYPFEAAHVDHNWRNESAEEADDLAQMCRQYGVPFHLRRLSLPDGKNMEDRARNARHRFFQEIVEERELLGVFLAHHADDQAETVLKRLFEGASLPKLRGLLPKIEIANLSIYRPLLKTRKHQILQWLNDNQLYFFSDPTNEDPKFLRSRLRNDVIPLLSKHFGKEIAGNLSRLAERAAELDAFVEETIATYREKILISAEGETLDFKMLDQSSFLRKAIIHDFFETRRLALSHSNLESILIHLEKENCHKLLTVGKYQVLIHKGTLTIFFEKL